jgi:AcrR family transcriptional regulator
MNDTKARILDAAERLIAEHGLDVSLRAITTKARVNLASVNYHFQSKDALIDAVIARRIEPVNERRIEMLEELERIHPEGSLPLEGVLNAFLAPVMQLAAGEHIRVLIGRMLSSPDQFMKRVFKRHLAKVVERFGVAFERALPGLPIEEKAWCTLFTVGGMVHLMAWSRMLPVLSHGAVEGSDPKAMTEHLVQFAAAGFRAAYAKNQGALHA